MSMSSKPLWFPVTKEQREGMKEGREVMQHYHDVIVPNDTIAVIVGMTIDREKYNYLLPRGIDVVPLLLTEDQIDSLDKQAIVSRHVGPRSELDVHIVDEEEFKKWREKNAK